MTRVSGSGCRRNIGDTVPAATSAPQRLALTAPGISGYGPSSCFLQREPCLASRSAFVTFAAVPCQVLLNVQISLSQVQLTLQRAEEGRPVHRDKRDPEDSSKEDSDSTPFEPYSKMTGRHAKFLGWHLRFA